MPVIPTYPGVYIEEIPSGVRTIVGVATSIAAFIGRSLRGPVSEPVPINNFGEFESRFGGLWLDGPMSYAVRDFYQNGGSHALIVRLFSDSSKKEAQNAIDVVVEAVNNAGDDVDAIKEAAQDAAANFEDEPTKTAVNQIVREVEEAADLENSTADSVRDAAERAADAAKAAIERMLPAAKLALPVADEPKQAVNAVVEAVNNAADEVDAIVTAARDAANGFPNDPEKTAANQVYQKVSDAAARGEQAATLKSVATEAKARTDAGLVLLAANPGKWGNKLEVEVNYAGISKEVADRYGLESQYDLFNLVVTDRSVDPATIETISNVSVVESSRRVDRILKEESVLIRAQEDDKEKPILPVFRPKIGSDTVDSADEGTDGDRLSAADYIGSKKNQTGLYALDKADLFNLLCIPPDIRDGDTELSVYEEALKYCFEQRAMLIVDPPLSWAANKETAATKAKAKFDKFVSDIGANDLKGRNAAIYFPRVIQADLLRENQLDTFVACGAIAGIMSRTDTERGVWKAPAGIDAGISGIRGLQVNLDDKKNGILNPIGINCLRSFPVYGRVVWGARTLRGADQLADEYKYLPVRRLLLFLQESLYRGTHWVVFEPNDEPLWAQIRLNLGTFMNDLFRQGAFQGKSPKEAYFVKCDSETTTQSDINRGIVNIIVGFAPLKPAEFVIIKFQQIARLPS